MSLTGRIARGALFAVAFASATLTADAPWVTDWEAAKKQAKEEKKVLLIDFSGSDWCGWCIRLEKEVFSQEAFIKGAKDKYVMVLLDFPKDKSKQSAELQAQNAKLKGQFPVRGYPSVFLATADGTPFAQTGYQSGGPEAYLKHLDKLRADHEAVLALKAKLPGTTGVERAKILDELVEKTSMPNDETKAYPKEIMELDADGKAGLKIKYEVMDMGKQAMALLRQRKSKEATEICDKALALKGLPVASRQELLFLKSQILFGEGDKKGAKAMLQKAAALAPDSDLGKQIEGILKGRWFKGIE